MTVTEKFKQKYWFIWKRTKILLFFSLFIDKFRKKSSRIKAYNMIKKTFKKIKKMNISVDCGRRMHVDEEDFEFFYMEK